MHSLSYGAQALLGTGTKNDPPYSFHGKRGHGPLASRQKGGKSRGEMNLPSLPLTQEQAIILRSLI
jgi:hypothetical protein